MRSCQREITSSQSVTPTSTQSEESVNEISHTVAPILYSVSARHSISSQYTGPNQLKVQSFLNCVVDYAMLRDIKGNLWSLKCF